MKRFWAISLTLLFITTATEFNQLLRMPWLFAHYTEHKAADQSISFIDFLHMHYTGHDNNDNDQDRDMQLPFKSANNCNTIDLKSEPCQVAFTQFTSIHNGRGDVLMHKHSDLPPVYLSAVWQPPKHS